MSSLSLTARDRVAGALWGMFIGDALSMPVHWIYDPDALRREYGVVRDYLPPKRSHPSSIMSLHSADRAGRKTAGHNKAAPVRRIVGDVILKGRRHLWEEPKLHYHFGLQAGDNTLNLLIARVLMRSIATRGRYDADHFLEQYIAFMTAEKSHNDSYAESYHRDFFANHASGVPARQCAGDEGHDTASMGGLVLLPPVILLNHADAKRARVDAMEQMQLTHKSGKLATHANAFSDLLLNVLGGADLKTAAVSAAKSTGGHDLPKLIAKVESAQLPDTAVIGQYFSSACYIDDSFPSMLYLATKYDTSPENGLIANTNCGGENCHKGAMLGALYGAAHGVNGFPKRWVDGLRDRDAIAQEIDAFLAVAFPSAAM